MRRIVIIEHEPLSKRLKEAFCIEELLRRGVDVEYWDVSKLINPTLDIPFLEEGEYCQRLESLDALREMLDGVNVEESLFIVEVDLSRRNRDIISLIESVSPVCAKVDLYANVVMPSPFWSRLLGAAINNPIAFIKHIIKVLRRRGQLIPFHYELTASSSPRVRRDVAINHPDYEQFTNDEEEAIIESPYIVFCDTYYPLHPDHTFSEEFKTRTSREYYRDMSALFTHLEQRLGMPVVIAAHPKARYSGEEFGGRRIISNESCNLIKHSAYALTAESSALSYIILADVPFAFIYPESYRGHRAYDMVQNLAAYCQMESYNINCQRWEDIQFCRVQTERRQEYIYGFLTSPESENRTNADSFVELLKLAKRG